MRNLLNFSGFNTEGLDSLEFEPPGSLSTHSQTDSVGYDAVQRSAQPLFQALVAVGGCLSSVQIKVLSEPDLLKPDDLAQSQSRRVSWVDRWRTAARQLLSFDRKILKIAETGWGFERGVLSSPARITGVASNLETRSLLLVLDYNAVWNGLSADQQLRLQHQIATFLSHGSIRLPSKSKALSFSSLSKLVARWMEKNKRFIQSVDFSPKLFVSSGSSIALTSEPDLEGLTTQRSEATSLLASNSIAVVELAEQVTSAGLLDKLIRREKCDRQQGQKTIEADVVSVTYVEHPLEKILKWVDRLLLWIERKWQRINQWLRTASHN